MGLFDAYCESKIKEYEAKIEDAQKRIDNPKDENDLKEAQNEIETLKAGIEHQVKNGLERQTTSIKQYTEQMKEGLKELKKERDLLVRSGHSEAAALLDNLLDLFDASGIPTGDLAKIEEYLERTMPNAEFNQKTIMNTNTISATIWEEDNLLRSPLNQDQLGNLLGKYDLVKTRLSQPDNQNSIDELKQCYVEINDALEEFHTIPTGSRPMKDTIGLKDASSHSWLKDQDYSKLSDDELKMIGKKAEDLLGKLQQIHARMGSLKSEKEDCFMSLYVLHTSLETSMSALTGEDKKLLGKDPIKRTDEGQLPLLISMINQEKVKRGI